MKVIVTNSYDETCAVIANMIKELVNAKPDAKLGLATGGTPVPIYKKLIEMNKAGEVDFSRVHTVNLDEYCGIPGTHDQSYRYFMDTNLFDYINIDKKNTFVASGMGDFEANARELEEKVREGGAADLQLLGIGNNGHIAFNEASDHLIAVAHTEKLTESTINANARFFEKKEDVPTMAITMGMGDILAAKKVVLAATGLAKVPAIRGLIMDDVITTQNPSTMLKMHEDAVVVIDRELADAVGYRA
ncbi:glucosamine-6-phosphate deaminase [Ruthenibacterium lactatiformans]|uniref:Glucosamine-6-phosphate deaminase n=1 Tax=Ruthenibacterium lactatiformans TaxID=1550024 RepID=A0A6L6LVI2_9FIRM|nr:glucosamine-6-phosphate deaminase [Ruthenibacterium lactatiformans]MTQ80401.1 glucosamine-6-phosphate deaminase [Ruthenibacterium lactatiformans]MTS21345.1 glucosamine-6-phosphate deaminase [Ruthenibacterium lactatiformans]MTS28269.1 glucosamine-6-phosphate deaminase [Ruthenibacterium lactatiformans]MTS31123.1 glucosamine-6-phosphate deaminase [Ruthenibacterium lactatiformans]MTS38516.1 glucosamine-6-phosphate deaminase [Ruthenibacterium lactatiformans]